MNTLVAQPHGLLSTIPKGLLIDGQWRGSADGSVFPVEDPATGEIIAEVADATPRDGADALDAAVRAQESWAATPPRVRGEILRRAFELVTERSEDFAMVMTLEMGKPLAEARGEVAYGADFLRWFSEEAVRISGRFAISPDGSSRHLVTHKPVGPCLLITPWNFPLAMATRKIAPAIAAGCTMVLKPANLTPLTSMLLASILEEAGLPKGVLNVIPTSSASAVTWPLLQDGRLRKVSFTGSTPVGRQLMKDSADMVLRTSMELGGNAPFIVFGDADIDDAVTGAMQAKLRNMGEACTAANRFIVHESVVPEFAAKLSERMSVLTLGHGMEPATQIGPLIDDKSLQKVDSLVRAAVDDGAIAVTGGRARAGAGHFYEPTVLTGVRAGSAILGEEIFGPVAPIMSFSTEDQAVEAANATEYGLAAYLFTRDLNRALRVAERIDSGMLGLNTGLISNAAAPFGGVKQSGVGREGGSEGISEYLTTQYIAIADPAARN